MVTLDSNEQKKMSEDRKTLSAYSISYFLKVSKTIKHFSLWLNL